MKRNNKQRMNEINEEEFNKKVESSNCMVILHPENYDSVHATVHVKFDFDMEEDFANEIVPKIADTILMSEIAKLIRNEYVIEVYGKLSFYPETSQCKYDVVCMRPVRHNLPGVLTGEGWKNSIDEFSERRMQEYKQGF